MTHKLYINVYFIYFFAIPLQISRIFCLYHLMNLINLMVVAMYYLVKSCASGDYPSSCVFC